MTGSSQRRVKAWLSGGGSLTARLREHGTVEVVVLREGVRPLWPQEQRDLRCRCGHAREIALLVDGRPAVWARSVTPRLAVRGAWKAMVTLGKRPLAELLFQGRALQRDPLVPQRLPRHGAVAGRMRSAWSPPGTTLPQRARSSVFWRKGQPLRVFEAFAPWVLRRQTF